MKRVTSVRDYACWGFVGAAILFGDSEFRALAWILAPFAIVAIYCTVVIVLRRGYLLPWQ